VIALATALFALPAPAIELGARVAYARGGGDARHALGLGFDGAYRFHPQLSIGIYTTPVFGLNEPSGCPSAASCTIAGGQAGAEARYRLIAEPAGIEPWVSAGIGIDVLQRKETTTTRSSGVIFSSTSTTEREWFLYGPTALFQIGLDARLGKAFTLGPWLGLGVGKYLGSKFRYRVNSDVRESTSGSADTPVHTWIFAGVRAAFEIHLRR